MSLLLGIQDGVAVVACYRTSIAGAEYFVVPQCIYCGREHTHAPEPGPRPAACQSEAAPHGGYILWEVPEAFARQGLGRTIVAAVQRLVVTRAGRIFRDMPGASEARAREFEERLHTSLGLVREGATDASA